MNHQPDYFSNHRLKLRFPWSLYHSPIVSSLDQAIRAAPGPEVLNVGSGPFFELDRLYTEGRRFSICDIDPRAIELASRLHGDRLARADAVLPDAGLPYADATFDLAVSMDVIEHLQEPRRWLAEIFRVVRPGGAVFLTTPNYGSWSLRFIEATALELVARTQGFSRRHLHTTKFDDRSLDRILREMGADTIRVKSISHGWVLSANARRAQ